MKILFVVKSKSIETLGSQYLAAVTKQAGHEAKIVALDEAVASAKSWMPDVIGFSVMTGDLGAVSSLSERIKDFWPKRIKIPIIIVGGPDPTFFPQGYEWADHVVRGEGENWLAEFLGGNPNTFSNINDFPWPDRIDFPDMKIRDFLASRGCVNACNYCYNESFFNLFPEIPRLRMRDPQDVVTEVESVRPQFAYFQDSVFGVSLKWLREFSWQYESRLRIPFHVHLRPDQVNEEKIQLLSDAGCVSVKMALETASSRLRKLINRGKTNNEHVYIAARLLKKEKIALILQNILGLPTATIENDLETLEANIRSRPAYAWTSIFQPYPETGLAKICEQKGLYSGDYSEIGDNFFDKSILNVSDEYKEHVSCLQRVFAFCVEMQVMPKVSDLTWERLPKFIHSVMRAVGDRRMFPGII